MREGAWAIALAMHLDGSEKVPDVGLCFAGFFAVAESTYPLPDSLAPAKLVSHQKMETDFS